MARSGLACVALSVLLAAAGCGGGGGTRLYALRTVASCFERAGDQAAALPNRTLPGTSGNLRVEFAAAEPTLSPTAQRGGVIPGAYVYLVFDQGAAGARATEAKAVALTVRTLSAQGLGVTSAFVRSGVGVRANVFYYSPTGPLTKRQRAAVLACLR